MIFLKKFIYAVIIILSFGLGILGGMTRIALPFIALGIAFSILILFLDYQRSIYLVALYVFLDFFIRQYVGSPLLGSLWDELLFIFVFLMWMYKTFIDYKNRGYRWTPMEAPLIFFFGIGIFLLIINSPNIKISIEGFRAVVQYMLWYFLVVQVLKTDNGARNLYKILVLIGIFIGLHGVYQYIVGVEMPATWVDSMEKGLRTRVYSIIGSPNILGSLMTLTVPMAIGLVYGEEKIGKKLFYGIGSIVMMACLVFTFSRGAWIGFMVAALVFILLKDKRLIIPAIIAGMLVIIFVPSIVDRITYMLSPQYISNSLKGGRLIRWITGLEMLKEQPLFGVGLGHFGGAVAMNNDIPGTFYMDNYYLKTAVEMGIVGLMAFWFLLYQAIIWSYRTVIKIQDKYFVNLIQGAIAGMMGVLAHNFFENVFEVPMMVTYFWILVGIIMYLRTTKVEKFDNI